MRYKYSALASRDLSYVIIHLSGGPENISHFTLTNSICPAQNLPHARNHRGLFVAVEIKHPSTSTLPFASRGGAPIPTVSNEPLITKNSV